MTYLEDTLTRRLVFFSGKGGVGKSSLTWATALLLAQRGKTVAVCSWDPFGSTLPQISRVDSAIEWVPLSTLECFREYALGIVRFETIYNLVFDNPILKTFVQAAPGLGETVIAGKIWDLWSKKKVDHLLVDLPASGHALSFFRSPLGIQRIFKFGVVHRNSQLICDMFQEPTVRLDLITLPEELPLKEVSELKIELSKLHPFSWGFLHVNRRTPSFPIPTNPSALASETIKRHEERFHQEEEELKSYPFKMPVISTPRFDAKDTHSTIRMVATHLEKQ